ERQLAAAWLERSIQNEGPEVSILVLLERQLAVVNDTNLKVTAALRFNPCSTGTPIGGGGGYAHELADKAFQSLFYWNANWRARLNAFSLAIINKLFQSLFYWNANWRPAPAPPPADLAGWFQSLFYWNANWRDVPPTTFSLPYVSF